MRRAALVALFVAQAGCAAHGRLGVDPASLTVASASPGGPLSAFVERIESNVCDLSDTASAARQTGSADVVRAVDELVRVADRACRAGLERLPVDVDEFGVPTLGEVTGGVARGTDGTYLVFGEVGEIELWSGRSATGFDACEGDQGAAPVAVVEVLGPTGVGVTVEGEGATIWAVPGTGEGRCGAAEDGQASLGLPGASGTWAIYADSADAAGVGLSVRLSDEVHEGAFYEWRAGTPVSIDVSIGPFTDSASAIGSWCNGYVPPSPQFQVRIPTSQYGSVMVTTEGDAVIVARSPSGIVTCNDDYVGLNPGLDQWFDAGVWEFWVGTYGTATTLSGTIDFY